MLWVAEYSASQDSFHVQLLKEALIKNLRRALRGEQNDWVAVATGREKNVRLVVDLIRQGQILTRRLTWPPPPCAHWWE